MSDVVPNQIRRVGTPAPQPRLTMLRSIAALLIRDVTTSNGRMMGGYLWALLEPVAAIILLVALFAVLGFRQPSLGTNFAIFFATGVLPFQMTMRLAGSLGTAIVAVRPLLGYPRVSFMDAVIARTIFVALTDILVFFIVITVILSIWETRTLLDIPVVILTIAMAISLGVGIGLLNCVLFAVFPLWQRVWGVISRPLFLSSGIFHLFEDVPHPYQDWLWYSPFIHITASMRSAFYVSYDAAWVMPVYIFGLSAPLAFLGLLFLRRYHRDILER